MDEIAHNQPHHDDNHQQPPDNIQPQPQDNQPTGARRTRHRPASSRDYHHDHSECKRPRIDTELPVVQAPRVDVTPTAATTAVSTPTVPSSAGLSTTPLASVPLAATTTPSVLSASASGSRSATATAHHSHTLRLSSAKRRLVRAAAPLHAASRVIPYGQPGAPSVAPHPFPDFRNSPHIPPNKPLINRTTLRELELDVILRNPVIRHDLLFDPGLQFRPRRKAEAFERYWNAVWEEVQTGCTCVTLDSTGRLFSSKICVCDLDYDGRLPIVVLVYDPGDGRPALYTHRAASRILPLLTEFLEVLLVVIQPLSNTAIYTDPVSIHDQALEHSAHAAHLRAIFDPEFIAQEVRHGVWDPEGVFKEIGETLKFHCAPMRDEDVDALVNSSAVKGEGMKAIKTCLELLELMKLDIANHQLGQLRPWLMRNTGTFEVKAFKLRFSQQDPDQANVPLSIASLHCTRQWLDKAHESLLLRKTPIPHHAYNLTAQITPSDASKHSGAFNYKDLTRNQKIYTSAVKGVVDLVFNTLHPTDSLLSPVFPTSSTPKTRPVAVSCLKNSAYTYTPQSSSFALVPMPETMYLDKSRLVNLGQDAGELTGLYMMLLLFRQLVFTSPVPAKKVQITKDDMSRMTQEIKDIAPVGFGNLLLSSARVNNGSDNMNAHAAKNEERKRVREDLVLQIATRACDVRSRETGVVHGVDTSRPTSCLMPEAPVLSLGRNWVETNLAPASSLSQFLHNRMRDAVFDAVLGLAWGGPGSANGSHNLLENMEATIKNHKVLGSVGRGLGAGMEALHENICSLAEKIARLALVHLNTHLPMYEMEGFFPPRDA
ncbi:Tcp11-domain-containing protein [Agrocybe pediades]|nr:Tcp11-domain-containing protein [Agrocybe pediades]